MRPDETGHFGPYGGRFVPEILMEPLRELEAAYADARRDPAFRTLLAAHLRDFVGRPTPLTEARRLSERLGCRLWLKGEDLMAGRAAVVDVEMNPGRIVLFGLRPQHRAQTRATFPMLFNSLYLSTVGRPGGENPVTPTSK